MKGRREKTALMESIYSSSVFVLKEPSPVKVESVSFVLIQECSVRELATAKSSRDAFHLKLTYFLRGNF